MPLGVQLVQIRAEVEEWRGRGLTEQDTKNALIEPLMASLGWPKTDLRRVRAEYRLTPRDNPVDYALFDEGRPVAFVEAKALDRGVDDRQSIIQVLNYANAASLEWAILTNGEVWDLYEVFDRSDVADRRVFRVRVGDADAERWLSWMTPSAFREGRLRRLRRFLTGEQKVHDALVRLVRERDHRLVALLAGQTALEPGRVATALGTLQPQFVRPGFDQLVALIDHAEPDAPASPAEPPPASVAVASPGAEAAPPPAPPPSPPPQPTAPAPAPVTEAPPIVPASVAAPVSGEVSRLATPTPGESPRALWVGEVCTPVAAWRTLLERATQQLALRHPEAFATLFDDPDFMGRTRRSITRSLEGLRLAIPVPGGFVEGNLSATSVVALVNRIADKVAPRLPLRWE